MENDTQDIQDIDVEPQEETLNEIKAIMEAQGLTFDDVNKLIKMANVKPNKEKKTKHAEVESVYKGIATYTCRTCGFEFDSTFSTNKRALHVSYEIDTCHECDARLLDCTKEELISKIKDAYHVRHRRRV